MRQACHEVLEYAVTEKILLKGKENACEQKAEARGAADGTLAALVNHGAGPPVAQEGRRHGGRLE